MIVVVADTSPLNYLVQIDCQELLPALYDHVLVPGAVIEELSHPRTPTAVRDWLSERPSWLQVQEIRGPQSRAFVGLGAGEAEVLQLAQEKHADLLLMDERRAVRSAQERGIEVIGTLGVLLQAARRNLITLDVALFRLQATNFRCTPKLLNEVRRRHQD